ncbi:hypothetical protein [Rhizobium sp. 21-4511-3d]
MTKPMSTFTFDPPSGEKVDIQDVCTWLIRVMNKGDKSIKFVASVLAFYLDRGGLSQKQYDHLQHVFQRVTEAFERGSLEVQGSVIARDDGSPTNIVSFNVRAGRGE